VVKIILSTFAINGGVDLGFPVEDLVADGIVEITRGWGIVFFGFLECDKEQVGACWFTVVDPGLEEEWSGSS